jgi:hypothetical protein
MDLKIFLSSLVPSLLRGFCAFSGMNTVAWQKRRGSNLLYELSYLDGFNQEDLDYQFEIAAVQSF